jgi:hypothetical protein
MNRIFNLTRVVFKAIKDFIMLLIKFAIDLKKGDLVKYNTTNDYYKQFEGKNENDELKVAKAYEMAWDARKFEIDNYWKRTTYFWAFQVTAFAAFLTVINSDSYNEFIPKNPEILFAIISFGFITSLAWSLINIGSKFWQRHWEKHIDMLEDKITGPLYKTVFAYKSTRTFSVSKLNALISRFFVLIWFILSINYCIIHLTFEKGNFAWIEISIIIGTLYFTCAMFFGYGRGRFSKSDFNFYERKVF